MINSICNRLVISFALAVKNSCSDMHSAGKQIIASHLVAPVSPTSTETQ